MNQKQIAFIICANDAMYYEECMRYINELEIPEGYTIDTLCIQEAESMAQGYNAAMEASEAKYKVYLHQDTFILNKSFLKDMLAVFESDNQIGMLGVVGTQDAYNDAESYLDWTIGNIDGCTGRRPIEDTFCQDKTKAYVEVTAISGVLIATQYDIPWMETKAGEWEFYNIYQSMSIQKVGYKVVVPYQEKAWCYHDADINLSKTEADVKAEELKKNFIQLFEIGMYENLIGIAEQVRAMRLKDRQIWDMLNLMEIYVMETQSKKGLHSAWFSWNNWNDLYEQYKFVRFILMRLEYGYEDERILNLKDAMIENSITKDVVLKIATSSFRSVNRTFKELLKEETETPLVSVIVTVYNGEDFLKETIDSVVQQTYQNLEIIVVDDASTDKSREFVSAYKDPRIRLLALDKNRHVCYAGNVGFKEATGKYVALIGHDDLWKADKIEKQVGFLESHPGYGACFTWLDIVDENRDVVNRLYSGLYGIFSSDNRSRATWSANMFFKGNSFCAPSVCIRKDVLDKSGYYRYGLVQLQDYELWMRVLMECEVYVLQEKLTLYRRFNGGNNLSTVSIKTQIRDRHETQYIRDSYLENISDDFFVAVFKKWMRNPNAKGHERIKCEKTLLLWDTGNCLAEKKFIELLEDEQCRQILEDEYDFSLKDFYEENTKSKYFDR